MMYIAKQLVVEAYEITRATRWNRECWPPWMREAWKNEAIYASTVTDKLALVVAGDRAIIHWGDYIVRSVDGSLDVWPHGTFEATFQRIVENRPFEPEPADHSNVDGREEKAIKERPLIAGINCECRTCRHCVVMDDGAGECIKRAPAVDPNYFLGKWPRVVLHKGCGEWEAK